ncbi:hypothetical protein E3T46_12310 [Cryobacterium sp. Hh11]|uniref:hypothetical protein n=1 Tax=Cryobacterium sp. Hh11 TaxID=2555868 RepID=UPI00106D5850|nr:hypothetical protein [Cryobacterium sp. Hh11]TFD50107.1 hypothetical protein E3T46_12310 [Cryobacterium sp. Hh11]
MTTDSHQDNAQPGGSSEEALQQDPRPNSNRPGGIALAALIVGIGAFVTGWIPVLGLILGINGIVLGVLAMRRPAGKSFGRAGLIGSALAGVTNVLVTMVIVISLASSGIGAVIMAEGQPIVTPCYSFTGPRDYTNSFGNTRACVTALELLGERDADGVIHKTGFGSVLGRVMVTPDAMMITDAGVRNGSLDDVVEFVIETYYPEAGEVTSPKEAVSLDGVDANLTRLNGTAENTRTRAFLTVLAPKAYQFAADPVKFFVISFVIPEDNGEEIIAAAIDSWRWK